MKTTRLYTLLGHMDIIQGESEQLALVLAECSYTCIIHLNNHRVRVCAHENFNAESKMWIFHADFLKANPMELGADPHQIHIQSASNYFDVDFQLPIDFKDKFQSGIRIKE